jgi:hypothetical protein
MVMKCIKERQEPGSWALRVEISRALHQAVLIPLYPERTKSAHKMHHVKY